MSYVAPYEVVSEIVRSLGKQFEQAIPFLANNSVMGKVINVKAIHLSTTIN